MEIRHLRYFDAVAQTLHFGRAAEQVHVAQPALSRAISQLERELGVQLLHRTTRSVTLTAAGTVYLEEVRELLRRLDRATDRARQAGAGITGTLRLGVTGSATYGFLPGVAGVLRTALPQVDVQVRTELLTPEQEADLVDDRLDLGILRPPVRTEGLQVVVVERERLLLALPRGHRLATRPGPAGQAGPVPVGALRDEAFVTYAASTRSVVLDSVRTACRAAGFEPATAHEVHETATMLALVAAGLGVALVPASAGALTLPGVTFRPTDSEVTLELALAWRRGDRSPVLHRTLAALTAHGVLPHTPSSPALEAS